jgi:hypothetical protein
MKPSRLEIMCRVTVRPLVFPWLNDIVPPQADVNGAGMLQGSIIVTAGFCPVVKSPLKPTRA